MAMVCRITAPKDIHIPIPGTYEYVILHDKRDFADVIKFKTLTWADKPGLIVQVYPMQSQMEGEGGRGLSGTV